MDTSTVPASTGTELDGTYHRNGVRGLGFRCTVDDTRLTVQFTGEYLGETQDETGQWHEHRAHRDPIVVPLAVITAGAAARPHVHVDLGGRNHNTAVIRAAAADGNVGVTVFDADVNWDGQQVTMVAVTALDLDPDEYATAVFSVSKLLDGDVVFGSNSWRGDHYHLMALAALTTPTTATEGPLS